MWGGKTHLPRPSLERPLPPALNPFGGNACWESGPETPSWFRAREDEASRRLQGPHVRRGAVAGWAICRPRYHNLSNQRRLATRPRLRGAASSPSPGSAALAPPRLWAVPSPRPPRAGALEVTQRRAAPPVTTPQQSIPPRAKRLPAAPAPRTPPGSARGIRCSAGPAGLSGRLSPGRHLRPGAPGLPSAAPDRSPRPGSRAGLRGPFAGGTPPQASLACLPLPPASWWPRLAQEQDLPPAWPLQARAWDQPRLAMLGMVFGKGRALQTWQF